MGSLFKAPKPPQEDPNVKAQRDAEQQRAEREKIRSIQDQMGTETRQRGGNRGVMSLLGGLGTAQSRVRSLLGTG